jgi:tRNA modification GTPase
MNQEQIIVALASAPMQSAIHLIRISGKGCISLVNKFFKGKNLEKTNPNQQLYGHIVNQEGKTIDEVMLCCFHAPKSYTKEEMVEISCHGSVFIAQKIMHLLCENGARPAAAGEFTQRAYLNGRFDLAQAEAVADLIGAETEEAIKLAMYQLKGGISNKIDLLRTDILNFLSLLELELDFAEEDVEFANRQQLEDTITQTKHHVTQLIGSFKTGNAVKNGIPLVIAGKPNAGKSTLLNHLLNEERAIVSDIPGTTRDTIEERFYFSGLQFNLIDTAGIRQNTDSSIEQIGIERTLQKLEIAEIIFYMFDMQDITDIEKQVSEIKQCNKKVFWIVNKSDKQTNTPEWEALAKKEKIDLLYVSAAHHHTEALTQSLQEYIQSEYLGRDYAITNQRHLHALQQTKESLSKGMEALQNGFSGEIVVFELKQAVENLGSITGKISNDEVLGNIFSKFCIGK